MLTYTVLHVCSAHNATLLIWFAMRSLQVQRKALLPKILDVNNAEATLRSAFKSPFPNAPARSDVSTQPQCNFAILRNACHTDTGNLQTSAVLLLSLHRPSGASCSRGAPLFPGEARLPSSSVHPYTLRQNLHHCSHQ